MRNLYVKVLSLFPSNEVEAHCDIPCGIYDPISAKIAAQTVQKMVLRIQSLQQPGADAPPEQLVTYNNTLGRYVTVKEEHAQVCKKELLILWGDYFKPEHLEKYPDLHSIYWEATKLCSTNKQQVNLDAAKQLVQSVDKVAEIYWASKNVAYKDEVADIRFGA